MLAVSPALNNAVEVNTEAFITLSKIAFSSLERLSTLNLNATRLALEEGASGFTSLLQAQDARTQQKLLGATPEKVTNNAARYLQGVQEIAAETKSEVIQLISSYFSSQGGSSNLSMGHLKGFEVFKDFAQQVIDMTAANTRAAGDSMARISSANGRSCQEKRVGSRTASLPVTAAAPWPSDRCRWMLIAALAADDAAPNSSGERRNDTSPSVA
jgi:hypothetical protein